MRTHNEILLNLLSLPAVCSLQNYFLDNPSRADGNLLASIICEDINGRFDLKFKPERNLVIVWCDYDATENRYRRALSCKIPEVFILPKKLLNSKTLWGI